MRVMGLMALGTERAAGMLGRDYLGKSLGFGGVLFVAAPAEIGDVGQCWLVGRRVVRVGVGGLRAVARFAGNMSVAAGGARFGFVVVAHHAGILAGEGNGVLADDAERRRVIMPVLAESLRDQSSADQQEGPKPYDENHGGADKMTRVTQKLAQSPSFPKGNDGIPSSKTGSKRP